MADDDSTPSFGDVVKAFTPPGTDFDEFKKALHSQGAPGAISPQLVEMLNKASAAGAIPAGMMAQSGTTCARCDHSHGGPPGQACLEAEAQYGRAYLRRRPDVQLDAISAGSQKVSAYQDYWSPPAGSDRVDFARADPGPCYGPACDHVSHPSPAQSAPPEFPPGMPSAAAVAAREQYVDFRRAGFTLDEAVKLLAALIASSRSDNSDTDN